MTLQETKTSSINPWFGFLVTSVTTFLDLSSFILGYYCFLSRYCFKTLNHRVGSGHRVKAISWVGSHVRNPDPVPSLVPLLDCCIKCIKY